MWKKSLIPQTATIRDAIAAIDGGNHQIALVVDEASALLGTVTDGDVRRAILKGMKLDATVSSIMSKDPIVAERGQGKETLLALTRHRGIHQVPLVDENRRVTGIETVDHILNATRNDSIVVLMAGGQGSRLRPLTEDTPKPLLEVGSKPLLETILETLISYGFHRFYIAVNYMADAIMQHFGSGERWNVDIGYLREEVGLGTAGALGLLLETPREPILMMNADLLTNINFLHLIAYHQEQGCRATMCVREHETKIPYGVVDIEENKVAAIKEKPVQRHFINAGIYVLEPDVLRLAPENSYLDMPVLIESLIKDGGEVSVFPIREFWLDIGQHDDYKAASGHYERLFK